MAKQKSREKKEFLIAQRDKVGPGYLNTPVWIIQKAGKRIWNRRQKRNWKIIRVCLQDLEKLGLVSKSDEKKGRVITAAGQKYLDKMADTILKDYNKYKIVKKEKEVLMTKETKEKSVFEGTEKKGKKDNKKKQEVEE